MRPFTSYGLALCATLAVSGCANDRPPVIEEYTGTFGLSRNAVMSSLSSDAAYRSAYILLGSGAARDKPRFSGQFCPEPPPDVAQSIAAAVSGSLAGKVTVPAGQTGGELDASFSKSIATEVAALLKRSQGLQFYRDQAFYTCVAYLNGVIDDTSYAAKLGENSNLAAELIGLEILTNKDVSNANLEVTGAIDKLQKALEDLKKLQVAPAKAQG